MAGSCSSSRAFGVEVAQKARISGHLRLEDQRRQLRPVRRWQEEPVEAMFALLEDRCREAIAAGISGEVIEELEDAIRSPLEQPVEELVAGQRHGLLSLPVRVVAGVVLIRRELPTSP